MVVCLWEFFYTKKWKLFLYFVLVSERESTTWLLEYGVCVYRCKQCDQIWPNFATLTKKLCIWNLFEGLFGIWQNFESILAKLLYHWANFHYCKWPNIVKATKPSGPTGCKPLAERNQWAAVAKLSIFTSAYVTLWKQFSAKIPTLSVTNTKT